MAFWFNKPHDFVFKAKQYIHLTLSGFPSSNGLTHAFSIASSPFDEDVVVTTRMLIALDINASVSNNLSPNK